MNRGPFDTLDSFDKLGAGRLRTGEREIHERERSRKMNNQETKQPRQTGMAARPTLAQEAAEAILGDPKGDSMRASDRVKSRKIG